MQNATNWRKILSAELGDHNLHQSNSYRLKFDFQLFKEEQVLFMKNRCCGLVMDVFNQHNTHRHIDRNSKLKIMIARIYFVYGLPD